MTRKLKTGTTFAALVLLAACGADAEDDADASLDTGAAADAGAAPDAGPAQTGAGARANLIDAQGASVGTVTIRESGAGAILAVNLHGLPAGTHAIHIHETGTCATPGFESAGGHFNPTGANHGFENPQGPHAGDMRNIEVDASGMTQIEIENDRVALATGANSLFDADGSAIVVHQGADDYRTDPAGAAGPRIACGVVER